MITINVVQVGDIRLVEIDGRIDSISVRELETALGGGVDATRPLLLDMSQVTYMSAAGLRVLRRLHDDYGAVYIAQPSQRVREVMQITGLDTLYKLYESRVEAIHTLTPVTNAHTHLELGGLKTACPGVTGQPFVPWIVDLVQRIRANDKHRERDARKAAEAGIQALLKAGTTVVGDITGTGASIEPLLASGLRGVVYVEIFGLTPEQGQEQLAWARGLIDKWRPKERNGMRIGLGLHAPYSVRRELWQEALDYARREALPVSIHAAESEAEQQYLAEGSGPFAEAYYPGLGFAPLEAPRKSAIAFLEEVGALELRPLLAHAVEVGDEDIEKIRASGSTVVHCPRSNLRLRCRRMPLEKYLAAGVPVLLGTDSLASSPSLNIFDELEVAVALHYGKVDASALEKLVHQTLPTLSTPAAPPA